jgi:predicted oxidoreductase
MPGDTAGLLSLPPNRFDVMYLVDEEDAPLIVGTMRLGKWGANLKKKGWLAFIDQCLEMGLNAFDHADIYGHYTTEEDFGKAFKGRSSLRDDIVLTTKCGIRLVSENRPTHTIKSYDSSAEHIIQSVDNSLRALHTDYIDRLLLHRPDLLMDVEEVAEAFDHLEESGKVLSFGVSNFSTTQVEMLELEYPLLEHQMEISLLCTDAFTDGRLDQCQTLAMEATAWSPLGGSDFFSQPDEPRNQRIRQMAEKLGKEYGATFDQIMLAFLARHPQGIRPVVGTTRIERIRSALAAMEIELSREHWYMLWKASTGEEIA